MKNQKKLLRSSILIALGGLGILLALQSTGLVHRSTRRPSQGNTDTGSVFHEAGEACGGTDAPQAVAVDTVEAFSAGRGPAPAGHLGGQQSKKDDGNLDPSRPHFDLLGSGVTRNMALKDWALHHLLNAPVAVVELPGHYPEEEAYVLFAELYDSRGAIQVMEECKFVRLSQRSLVALVPTSRRVGSMLRLTLRCGDRRHDSVEIPVAVQGFYTLADASNQAARMLSFPSKSAVSQAYRHRLEAGQGRREALSATRENVQQVAALLRLQFSNESTNAVSRLDSKQAVEEVERMSEAASVRIGREESR